MTIEYIQTEDLSTWTLEELATSTRREHGLAREAAAFTLMHAIRAGEYLLAAKERVTEAGQWTEWVESQVDVSHGVITVYMRLAHYKDQLPPIDDLSITQAARYLRGLPQVTKRTPTNAKKYPDELKQEAKRLHDQGLGVRDIGRLLGATHTTIMRWLDPEFNKQQTLAAKKSHKAHYAAKKALAEQERRNNRDHAAKNRGGALADAYSYVRRLDAALDQALTEAKDRETKGILRAALSFAYKVEDEIVEALGVS